MGLNSSKLKTNKFVKATPIENPPQYTENEFIDEELVLKYSEPMLISLPECNSYDQISMVIFLKKAKCINKINESTIKMWPQILAVCKSIDYNKLMSAIKAGRRGYVVIPHTLIGVLTLPTVVIEYLNDRYDPIKRRFEIPKYEYSKTKIYINLSGLV